MIKIKLIDYLKIKNLHKDLLIDTSSYLEEIISSKDKVFYIKNSYIYIGENKYQLEELLLNKIKLNDDILCSIEHELLLLKDKYLFNLKKMKDLITELNTKIKYLDNMIDETFKNKNNNVIDILNVISNSYKNVVCTTPVYADNIVIDNNHYLFSNGERKILDEKEFKINELSQNYKIEITFNKIFLSYISFNDKLKSLNTFKVYFVNGNTQVKFVKEFNLKDKLIDVNDTCSKIIVEGVGAYEICKNIKICVGKNTTNINRGILVLECNFEKVNVANLYHISANQDIKIFLTKKAKLETDLTYNEFKAKYYLLENLIDTNIAKEYNLLDNYLILFIESNNSILNKINVYGVDE